MVCLDRTRLVVYISVALRQSWHQDPARNQLFDLFANKLIQDKFHILSLRSVGAGSTWASGGPYAKSPTKGGPPHLGMRRLSHLGMRRRGSPRSFQVFYPQQPHQTILRRTFRENIINLSFTNKWLYWVRGALQMVALLHTGAVFGDPNPKAIQQLFTI